MIKGEPMTDSYYKPLEIVTQEVCGFAPAFRAMRNPWMSHEKADWGSDVKLARKLILAGDEQAKALRGVIVYAEMKAQIGWIVEFDTYRIGIETLSTSSTMHLDFKGMKGPELASAKQENLPNVVYQRGIMASYQALRRVYKQRRNHRHPDWRVFCEWIESLPGFTDLIWPEHQGG